MKAILDLTQGGFDSSILIDGVDLARYATRISVESCAGQLPELTVALAPVGMHVTVDGTLKINADEVPDVVAFAVYEALKARYENTPNTSPAEGGYASVGEAEAR